MTANSQPHYLEFGASLMQRPLETELDAGIM